MSFDFDSMRLALTPAEAAETLGVSKAHLYRLIKRGVVPAKKLGRRLAVPSVALMQLLDISRPTGGGGGSAVEPPASPLL